MKGSDSYQVRVTYKRTNRSDWWINIYDGSNQSFPFPWMRNSTTVQQAIDGLLGYVIASEQADWSFDNVGKKHNALLEKKGEIYETLDRSRLPQCA